MKNSFWRLLLRLWNSSSFGLTLKLGNEEAAQEKKKAAAVFSNG